MEKKILLVDDEPSVLRVLDMKFKNAGFKVLTASDGMEGLEIIEKELPDVVISDNRMPNMSGIDLCVACKKIREKRNFLFIMLSSYASVTSKLDREWVNSLSDTVFIPKPFSPRNILKTVKKYFADNEERV
ncbi:MAG: hypothetical protein A2149_06645 [Candidatus Schekmanbacteria bacterium RBG_16_38_11]|uniref:Response regulatory domain-containing protein n=2 Tax=Candidatus Schekmaniibacteriota TaxID=1817811 RepID=A0A1F7RP11_9BACT|nr:MAG: hypothetical protein A2042_04995 [Candidatus Schekmanbacteria bacterium GWA2_38_11]OGL46788.1 MAG: hypothetical protein A2149_06645 [Candidatus Schekmanbacteria bacterium RBG_16_38_11]